jgi:hypothetical protein
MLSILLAGLFTATAAAQGSPVYDVTTFGAKCDSEPGSDVPDTAAFQAAINQVKATGGTIEVPPTTGGSCFIDSTLDFSNTGGVCLVGGIATSALPGAGSAARPQLVFTQQSGPIIKFGGSAGFCMKDLQLYALNSGFTGVFIEGHTSQTWGSGFATFQNLNIGTASTATSCIISFDSTYNSIIDTVEFGNGQALVCGPVPNTGFSYNNTIRNSMFEGGGSSALILNPSNGWTIGPSNDFELFQSGGAPIAVQIQNGVSCRGITVMGNWSGDTCRTATDCNTNIFNLIDIPSTSCSVTVRDNFLSGGSQPSGALTTTAIHMAGGRLVADGNVFDGIANPFNLGSGIVADIGANTYQDTPAPTPVSWMGGGGRLNAGTQTVFYGDGAGGLPALQANGGLWLNGNASTTGNVTVNGTLSKSAGAFKIDHPLDPDHKYLLHSFVESPDMKNIYEGTATLDNRGEAEVRLPDYFESLNRDFRYQLSPLGEFAPVFIAREIEGNSFRIAGGKPGLKVSWLVTGIRQDAYANAHRIQVEELKTPSLQTHSRHPMPTSTANGKSCSQQILIPGAAGQSNSRVQPCRNSER